MIKFIEINIKLFQKFFYLHIYFAINIISFAMINTVNVSCDATIENRQKDVLDKLNNTI